MGAFEPTTARWTRIIRDQEASGLGNGKHLFDVVYTLDALNRVIGADEGNKSGSSIESGYHTRNELWNSLSLTGNWGNRKLDANGDGDFGDEEDRDEPLADQVFTKANEWTDRKIAKASGGGADHDTYEDTHDAVGNLTVEDLSGLRGVTCATPRPATPPPALPGSQSG